MARTQVTGEGIRDNSVEGIDINESTLLDTLIPYASTESTADNVHDAITESRKKSVVPWHVAHNDELTISEGTQLLNYNGMEVRGQLTIKGMLVLK